jgi:hypothetical protein
MLAHPLLEALNSVLLSGCGPRFDYLVDCPLPGLPGGAKGVFELETKPELSRRSQVSRQAQGGVGGDSPAATHHIIEARCGNAQCFGELVNAHAQRFEKIIAYRFAGMRRRCQFGHNVIIS